jgi:hypothetical protein
VPSATFHTVTVPSSLPFCDIETATFAPSSEGA